MVGREREETLSDLHFKQGRGIEIVMKTPPSRISSKGGVRGVRALDQVEFQGGYLR